MFDRPAGIRFSGLYLDNVDSCGFDGSAAGVAAGCAEGFRSGWFGFFTGQEDAVEPSEVLVKGDDFESGLCMGQDGGGFALVSGAARGRPGFAGASLQNQPILLDFSVVVGFVTTDGLCVDIDKVRTRRLRTSVRE